MAGRIEVKEWGQLPDGRAARKISLSHPSGCELVVSDFGGIVTDLRVPTQNSGVQNMVLDLPAPSDYLAARSYLGAIAGRFANRIEAGRFLVDGVAYQLATNDSPGGVPCHLHGGNVGFDQRFWRAEPFSEGDTLGVRLDYTSPAGEEGYPGELHTTTTYRWTEDGTWEIEYVATSTAATMVNLTQHSYFDLGAARTGHTRDLQLRVDADAFTPVGPDMIPRGEIAPLAGTPLDLRSTTRLG
ncbi:MAG: galactose-1-epimerase, partial [Fimbriimonadaceae bacterium]